MSSADNVKVALRIRPLVQSERDRGCQEAIVKTPGMPQVIVNKTDAFTFNYVFDPKDTQEYVYNECVASMLEMLSCGFNATILAYGQTGSGKTHTMGTAFSGDEHSDVGVIPRAINDIFKRIEQDSGKFDFVVTCSFMELYQEHLYDLLSQQAREQSIVEMREDRNGIIMPNLTEFRVRSAHETTDCLMRGSGGRAVASTAMNEQSSRSHAIFCVTIQATDKTAIHNVTTSKFHLVDLAGSERSKKTQATGDRFKEGVKINQGLLALGNVISALGSNQGSGFVRYRDSKLTRLLQDSLGGNSITLMIACVSPADYNVAETLSTLRYADRARMIKNKPIVNQNPHAAEVNHLKEIIQKLRLELLNVGGCMSGSLTGALQNVVPANASIVQCKQCHNWQEKNHNLQQQLQLTLHDVAENEMRTHIAEAANEQLKIKMVEMKQLVTELKDSTTATPEQRQNRILQICTIVQDIDEELERTQSEKSRQKLQRTHSFDRTNDGKNGSVEINALMQEQNEAFTNKQMGFNEQLRRINRELSLKEELQQRVAGNFNKFCTLEENIDEKYQECEKKIEVLESEKSDLLDKLRHVRENASAKLAEERRKRLQALEKEISEMKRSNTQQAKLLKVREKETQKIRNLSSEIQTMKETKVKLIREMRQESENFRQWKLMREKELLQLKNKDRKMQNEMVRKEVLHAKQRNVLKRKCEEAQAINKRLKEVLERQSSAQLRRHKSGHQSKETSADNETSKIENIVACVDRDLEVIISLMDAEHSLEQLMEDRGIISTRIAELETQQDSNMSPTPELVSLQEEIEMRNAQIADFQQKVCAADLNARMRSLCDTIESLPEARAVFKHLIKTITEMRRNYTNQLSEQRAVLDEQRAVRKTADERSANAARRLRLMEIEHEEAMAERENAYEEKIALLLREMQNTPNLDAGAVLTPEQEERRQIQEEMFNKMDTMREELDKYKALIVQLEAETKRLKTRKTAPPVSLDGYIVTLSDDESLASDNVNEDPDWKKTPRFVHRKRCTKYGSRENIEEASINSSTDEKTSVKSRKKKGCGCRGYCHDKRCGCFSSGKECTMECRCTSKCAHKRTHTRSLDDDNKIELNLTHTINGEADETYTERTREEEETENINKNGKPTSSSKLTAEIENIFLSPEKDRFSSSCLTFNSAMKRQKFFQ